MGAARKHTFILHLWVERDPGRDRRDPAWRGSIEHLATKRRLYFSVLTELVGFLGRHLDEGSGRAERDDAE